MSIGIPTIGVARRDIITTVTRKRKRTATEARGSAAKPSDRHVIY